MIRGGKAWAIRNSCISYEGKPCPICGRVKRYVIGDKCLWCCAKDTELRREFIAKHSARVASLVALDARGVDEVVTYAAARAAGLPWYRTGVPCGKGHIPWRWIDDAKCVTCWRLKREL